MILLALCMCHSVLLFLALNLPPLSLRVPCSLFLLCFGGTVVATASRCRSGVSLVEGSKLFSGEHTSGAESDFDVFFSGAINLL
jgi:hypothetical protein